jgi:hypothetical protein
MGGLSSGWKRDGRRLTTEQVQRVDAITHGAAIVKRETPTGGEKRFGACGICGRGVRYLYIVDCVTGCEKCLKLTRASRQQSHTAREELRRAPELLGRALDTAGTFIEAAEVGVPDLKDFEKSMRILSAGATQSAGPIVPADALTSAIIDAATVPDNPTLQERVIMSDVAKTTKLLEHVERLIESEEENHIDRLGDSSKKPMRIDSLSKLGHLWVALSNVRAARSGVATEITEKRTTPTSGLSNAMRAAMNGGRDRDGYSLDELEAVAEGKVLSAAPEAAPAISNAGAVWDVPAMDAPRKS